MIADPATPRLKLIILDNAATAILKMPGPQQISDTKAILFINVLPAIRKMHPQGIMVLPVEDVIRLLHGRRYCWTTPGKRPASIVMPGMNLATIMETHAPNATTQTIGDRIPLTTAVIPIAIHVTQPMLPQATTGTYAPNATIQTGGLTIILITADIQIVLAVTPRLQTITADNVQPVIKLQIGMIYPTPTLGKQIVQAVIVPQMGTGQGNVAIAIQVHQIGLA